MSTLTSNLRISLIDDVSRRAGAISKALALAEKQTRALATASKLGVSERMATQLQRVGASAREIDKVTEAWRKYSQAQRLASNSSAWSAEQRRGVKEWERANLAAIRRVHDAKKDAEKRYAAAQAASGAMGAPGAALLAHARSYIAPAAAGYAVQRSVRASAADERAVERIGITAEASKAELRSVGETAFKIAQDVALPYEKVREGLNVLVTAGRSLPDALDFLPSVAATAQASGAAVDDIAKTADAVGGSFKVAGHEMQRAFDIMVKGGKEGKFELDKMARYLPSLGPAAAAAGFTGTKGLTDLVAMLQVLHKGTGTPEEAATSMSNILQKMESEETVKRFAKFGKDLPAHLAKAKKEGRNLVEAFMELTSDTLQGDLAKIPKLFNDMEFARGVRAMMQFKGEAGKMAQSIQATAAGTVERDLDRVTANTQAKLDRLANSYERRMRQLGEIVSDIVVPIDKKLEEIQPKVAQTMQRGVAAGDQFLLDAYAQAEMRGGVRYDVDPQKRAILDARKAKLERDAYDAKVGGLDADIAKRQQQLDNMPGGKWSPFRGHVERQQAQQQAERAALIASRRMVEELQLKLAENQAAQRDAAGGVDRLRFGRGVSGDPTPIVPGSFGLGRYGAPAPNAKQLSRVMRLGRDAAGNPMTGPIPLPPARPGPAAGPTAPAAPGLKSFGDIFEGPKFDTSSIDAVEARAKSAGAAIETSLGVTVRPNIDTSGVDALIAKVGQAKTAIDGLGAAASRSSGIVRRRLDGNFADGD